MRFCNPCTQIVAPKKAKLAAATAEFEELQAALAAKKAILKQVEEKLAELNAQLSLKGEEKAALEAEVLNCENVRSNLIDKLCECLSNLNQNDRIIRDIQSVIQ